MPVSANRVSKVRYEIRCGRVASLPVAGENERVNDPIYPVYFNDVSIAGAQPGFLKKHKRAAQVFPPWFKDLPHFGRILRMLFSKFGL